MTHGDERVYALRNYALLADGERGALIDPEGNVAWMCAPRWHDAAMFSVLIGGRGVYAVKPTGRFVWGGYYEPRSLIWRSRWITEDAIVECREALALPADEGRIVILRRIEMHEGDARMRVRLDPRAGFGDEALRDLRRGDDGGWHGRTGDLAIHWWGAEAAEPHEERGIEFELDLTEGDTHELVLAVGHPPDGHDPALLWRQTEQGWQERVPELEHTLAPRDSSLAVAVMCGLTPATGGMVAAATMALPERARAGNSYDYRYAWIRDGCYAGQAAAAAGVMPLMDATLRFSRERLLDHGPDLKPAYTAQGDAVPEESKLELPGYPGGTDIIGNQVTHQFQLDAFGEVMLLIASAARHDRVEADDWRAAELAVQVVRDHFDEPEAGIWELDPEVWTHSRLCVIAGLRGLADSAPDGVGDPDGWRTLADELLERTSSAALHPSGRWQRAPDDERVDAALLVPALHGAVPADDPRTRATLRTVLDELTEEHFVYRFRHDERPLGEAEGAFLLCGFWASMACLQQGHHHDALRFFERTRSACGSPGLLSEELDVGQRQLRGNLPQAFVHALLLECATELGKAQGR